MSRYISFILAMFFFDGFCMLAPRKAGNPVGYLEDISGRGHIGSDTTEC